MLPMSPYTALKTLPLAADGTSGLREIQMSIGRWLAEQCEVPSDIPERLATLLEQLVEPTGNEN
jgi:hypothetical protein